MNYKREGDWDEDQLKKIFMMWNILKITIRDGWLAAGALKSALTETIGCREPRHLHHRSLGADGLDGDAEDNFYLIKRSLT